MRTLTSLVAFALCWHMARPTEAAAGARAPMGQPIENAELATAAGGKEKIWADAKAQVLVFFRPDQKNHASTLAGIANCEKELAGKDVRWVALVPERFSAADAKAAADAAGLQMPVLIDVGEAVYNRVGVSVHPTVVVLDEQHKLAQFQAFTKLNFCELVMARVRRVLGEVDDAELARLLDPSAAPTKTDDSRARTELKMAAMLLKSGNTEKALEMAKKGAQKDPKSAAAQAMIGQILAKKGDCAAAAAAFEAALRLDPGEELASAGKKACAGRR